VSAPNVIMHVPSQSTTQLLPDMTGDDGNDDDDGGDMVRRGHMVQDSLILHVHDSHDGSGADEETEVESVSQSSDDYDTHTNPRTTIDESQHSAHTTPRSIRSTEVAPVRPPHHERMASMLLKGQLNAMCAIKEDEERVVLSDDEEESEEESNRLLHSKEETETNLESQYVAKRRKSSQAIQLLSANGKSYSEDMAVTERGHNKSATSRSIIEDSYLKYLQ